MFEWDEKKRAANLAKHGIDFEAVWSLEWRYAWVRPDTRREYGEKRSIALGFIGQRLYCCAYAERGGKRRIISLRKANAREMRYYAEETAD